MNPVLVLIVLIVVGALGLVVPAVVPGVMNRIAGWERPPWLTLAGLSTGLIAAGIVGLLAASRLSDPAWLWGASLGAGVLGVLLHAVGTRSLER